MAIERIDPSTIPWRPRSGRRSGPETKAVLALAVGEALKYPCRWKHTHYKGNHYCGGGHVIHAGVKRYGISIRTTCQNGVLYVMRVA